PQAAVTGTAAISGVVTDAMTGKPIAGALVGIQTLGSSPQDRSFSRPSFVTDARGRFVFTDLPSALRYNVYASRPGYTFGSIAGTIKLADAEWISGANIKMTRAAWISGRVIDER